MDSKQDRDPVRPPRYAEFLDQTADMEVRTITFAQEQDDGTRVVFERAPVYPEAESRGLRGHVFNDPETFIAYLAKYGGSDTLVLARPIKGAINASINDLSNEQPEIVTFFLDTDPLFESAWGHVVASGATTMSVPVFGAMLRSHKGHIVTTGGGVQAMIAGLRIKSHEDVTIAAGTKALNAVRVETVLQGQTVTETVDIPEELEFSYSPFPAMPGVSISFFAGISVRRGDPGPVVTLTSESLMCEYYRITRALLERIKAAVPDATVGMGSLSYDEPEYKRPLDIGSSRGTREGVRFNS